MKNSFILTLLTFCLITISCGDDCTETTWYQDLDADGLGNIEETLSACEQPTGYVTDNTDANDTGESTTVDVDQTLFLVDGSALTVTTVDCTLSDGTVTKCYQLVSKSSPSDHDMGPWCPDNISDGEEAGGIWLEGGEVYDVDGDFIANMAT